MAKIQINNPRQTINGGAKKYYFKVKGLGGPKGDKGDKGDTGSRGPQGEPGNAATVYVGSTTTLPVGQDATVENVGTQYNAVLNFGIPQGPRGPQGVQGERGEPGQTGQTGPRGPQGERGTNATVYVGTTTTTNPGTQARVYNSGTDSNAVLNFEIPRGDVGPSVPLVQETGNSTTKAMSQNATTEALNGKQNTLTAGANIQIQNGTISATDTTYTAGNGLNLNGTEFSADTTVLATKSNLDGYYTKPETDNLLAPKLEAEVVAELPTTGIEGKLYLTPKAHTTSTATGNPVTATVAEQAGALESFQLDGDTFQQTYTGKNLFNADTETLAFIDSNGNIIAGSTWSCSDYIKVSPNTTYTWHGEQTGSLGGQVIWAGYDSSQAFISGQYAQVNNTAGTSFTTGASTEYVRVGYRNDRLEKMQLELGSTASAYEPFVGGQPSPNPEYPQPIQTVTGTQTISINGMDYPLDLGTIELCKLDTYQDYICKNGNDWKVHKAVGKAELWKGTNWRILNTTRADEHRFSVKVSNTDIPASGASSTLVHLNSNYWPACTRLQTYQQTQGIAVTGDSDFSVESFIAFVDSLKTSDVDGWRAWLTANKPVVYYPSTTPTDTVITDQTLIAQLEAIRTASLENGANTITNTATGTNLAGDMEIGYYGYNPRNRYDKWLWLDINNEYEQIGS